MRRLVLIVDRQKPHEAWQLGMSVLIGIVGLIPHDRTGASAELNDAVYYVWVVSMLLAGAVGLFALYGKLDIDTSLILERSAMFGQTGALIVYMSAIVMAAGVVRAAFVVLILLGWAIADITRAIQITLDLQRLQQ